MKSTEAKAAPVALNTSKAYSVLDRVVTYGYDYVGVRIGGVRYILKTLTREEEELVRLHTFDRGHSPEALLWTLAYGTLSLEGKDLLESRGMSTLEALRAHYSGISSIFTKELYSTLVALSMRVEGALTLFQGYMFSPESRTKWKSFLHSGGRWGVSNFVGRDVGSHFVREMWARANAMLDREDKEEAAWDHTMFAASAYNPKGVKDASVRRQGTRKVREADREELVRYGSMSNRDAHLELQRKEEVVWHAPLVTQQDIIDELHRQVRGEKDRHDLFVEAYFKKVAEESAAATAARETARLAKMLQKEQAGHVRFEGQREATAEELSRAGIVPAASLPAGRVRGVRSNNRKR